MAGKRAPLKKKQVKRAVKKKAAKKAVKRATVKPKSVSGNKTEKLKISDATGLTKYVPVMKQGVAVALLSPLRYPVNYDLLAAHTARFAGIAFVVVGAVLAGISLHSYNFLEFPTETTGNVAATVDSTGHLVIYYETFGNIAYANITDYNSALNTCEDQVAQYPSVHIICYFDNQTIYDTASGGIQTQTTTESTTTTTQTTQDPQPAVDFNVSGDTSSLKGKITITYTVPYANSVEARAIPASAQNSITLGTATQSNDNTWKFNWDTSRYANGDYKLVALVTNQYGSYDQSDSSIVTVNNTTEQTTTTTSTSDTSSTPTATTDTQMTTQTNDTQTTTQTTDIQTTTDTQTIAHSVMLSFSQDHSQPMHGNVTVSAITNSASKLTLFIDGNFIGLLSYKGSNTWAYSFDSSRFTDGSHSVYAKVYLSDTDTFYSDSIDVYFNNTGSNTVMTTTATTTDTTNSTLPLQPSATLEFSNDSALSGKVGVKILVDHADFIEFYALPLNSLTPQFLGLANKVASGEWRFNFDTTQIPNGGYKLFVRIKNSYGLYESERLSISVKNDTTTTYTDSQTTYMKEVENVQKEIDQSYDIALSATAASDDGGEDSTGSLKTTTFTNTDFTSDVQKNLTDDLISQFQNKLRGYADDLARAIRNKDTDRIAYIKSNILGLRKQVIAKTDGQGLSADLIKKIDAKLTEIASAFEDLTAKNEKIIEDRVGSSTKNDSDKDGITDYDEINIYHTDPFSADTDKDGITDGVEILGGHNPNDASPEALVQPQSPQESGIVREDLLSVDSIETVSTTTEASTTESTSTTERPEALIRGKGLPNSFVTLYIYSTPIIVTVKTADDGSWSYTFDKELADGEHQVYVGITDNAGRIVAKSKPLAFVKTAQAFTAAQATTVSAPIETPERRTSLFSGTGLLIAGSFTIVALGLLLILLGMHVRHRQSNQMLE